MMTRPVDKTAITAFYDRFGARQDRQSFYEDPALARMIRHGDFAAARSVFEFGCGTGRLAENLLRNHLPDHCSYLGLDASATMVELAARSISPWRDRARIAKSNGSLTFPPRGGACDRFVTTYVLDILSQPDIDAVLAQAHHILAPGGLFCATCLTEGATPASRAVTAVWKLAYRIRPLLVGGCRPLALAGRFQSSTWTVLHQSVVTSFAISSEIVVAKRR